MWKKLASAVMSLALYAGLVPAFACAQTVATLRSRQVGEAWPHACGGKGSSGIDQRLPTPMLVALFAMAACALLWVALPDVPAWADDGHVAEYCGYAYLDPAVSGSAGNTLVIQEEARQEQTGYRYLGRVPSSAASSKELPWYNSGFKKVVFSGKVSPKSVAGWFYGSGVSEVDLACLDGTQLVDASGMLQSCANLTSIDLSGFTADSLVNIEAMFMNCSSLKTVSLARCEMPSVANASHLFSSCGALEKVDLSGAVFAEGANLSYLFDSCASLCDVSLTGFKALNVSDARAMFKGCAALERIDLSGLAASGEKSADEGMNANGMFAGCRSLMDVTFPSNGIALANVDSLFEGCSALKSIDLSAVRTVEEAADDSNSAFNYCPLENVKIGPGFKSRKALRSLFYLAGNWVVNGSGESFSDAAGMIERAAADAATATEFVPSGKPDGIFVYATGEAGALNTLVLRPGAKELADNETFVGIACESYRPWEPIKGSIEKVRIEAGDDDGKIVLTGNISGWFAGFANVTAIEGLGNLDTSAVTRMSSLFAGCSSLNSLDPSPLDTSSVKDMQGMFQGCSSLASLDVSALNTSSVQNMTDMFRDCSSLASLVMTPAEGEPAFVTPNVTDMQGMFQGCSSLASLDVSTLDASKVTSTSFMFQGCSSLARLDVSALDTSSVVCADHMFSDCSGLSELVLKPADGAQTFVTSSVENMAYLLSGCSKLSSLDATALDTSSATDMQGMFQDCSSLASLDLGGFVIPDGALLVDLLFGCSSLERIVIPGSMADVPDFPVGMWRAGDGGRELRFDRIPGSTAATYERVSGKSYYWANLSAGTLTVGDALPSGDGSVWKVEDDSYYAKAEEVPWHDVAANIKRVVVEGGIAPNNAANWFNGCANLESADVRGLSRTGSLSGMFAFCPSLTSVDLSGVNTANVDDFSTMFRGCKSLASLDLSGFSTGNATSMKRMFHGCRSLQRVTLGAGFSFFGSAASRLPGSELPVGAWKAIGETSTAWASDSLPNFTAATYELVSESTEGLTVVTVRGDAVRPTAKYSIETTYGTEGGDLVASSSYKLDDGYDLAQPLVIGGSAKASSVSSKTVNDSSVTRQRLKSVVGKVNKVVLGPSVSSVSARAFADAPSVTKLHVESSRLNSKAKVISCLFGSKVISVSYKSGMPKVVSAFKSYAWKKN